LVSSTSTFFTGFDGLEETAALDFELAAVLLESFLPFPFFFLPPPSEAMKAS